ncbi:hypothetical protein EYB53_023735 [Candidatus Chloroploca sp. M-50]|uniref:Uncharacterized protein n=1 Tax=Candidatus Chloroploca mongolica TaxID=2528176 RepID=A0ABS4DH37_9CHLR|nr:hypothetical protein [Candidatus Chloroploca mongolica]MBP1468747.1 hypothetical protein [Candidatus Chloroploca mongolica]
MSNTTFEQWRALMPARGEQRQNDDDGPIDGAELWSRSYGGVATTVSLPLSWPGLVAPDALPDAVDGHERKRFGRWVLDRSGLVCLGAAWDISDDRFDELDWLAHVLGHNWCYDPTDFFDALQEGRRAFCARLGENWIDEAVWIEIRAMLATGELPFYPSSMMGDQWVYLPNRMTSEQRDAFARFLVEHGITAS